jgi:hypothetical protein
MKRKVLITVLVVSLTIIITGAVVGSIFLFRKDPKTKLFLAIHCEPGSNPSILKQPLQYWPALKQMVTVADSYDIKLTILFNPQWGQYILLNTTRLNLVRAWEINGHEIGVHHHGPHHQEWNGYTNQVNYLSNPNYLGNISDMMSILNQLPSSGKMLSGCISTTDDIPYDCPQCLKYSVDGGSDKVDHLYSKPALKTFNGVEVYQVTHAIFNAIESEVNIDLEHFGELYKERNNEYIMGLVWHAFNYDQTPQAFDSLFGYLHQESIQTYTLTSIFE